MLITTSKNTPVYSFALWAMYLLFIIYGVLAPFDQWRYAELYSLQHWLSSWLRYVQFFDVLQNLLLYIPFGFIGGFCFAKSLHFGGFKSATIIFVTSIILSSVLETLQLFNPVRYPSPLDVFLNSVGGLLGALLYLVLNSKIDLCIQWFSNALRAKPFPWVLRLLGVCILITIMLMQWYPFLPSLHPKHIYNGILPSYHLLQNIELFNWFHFGRYIAYGMASLIALVLLFKRAYWLKLGSVFIILLLSSKIFIVSRQLSIEALAGCFLGLTLLYIFLEIVRYVKD